MVYTAGMYHPTTRVLTVLELLQSHRRMTGAELAQRLEVSVRTLRRYISMLEELGIPIVAERGRYGAYELIAGFKLPPMMFTNDEALALAIGLLAAQRLGLTETAHAVESTRAKLERVMPAELKERLRALSETVLLDLDAGRMVTSTEVMMTMSRAAQSQRRVHDALSFPRGRGDPTRARPIRPGALPGRVVRGGTLSPAE